MDEKDSFIDRMRENRPLLRAMYTILIVLMFGFGFWFFGLFSSCTGPS